MRTISRSQIRGKKIDIYCRCAKVCAEFSEDTKYCFCYGIKNLRYDEYYDECKECKACVKNMPLRTDDFKKYLREDKSE